MTIETFNITVKFMTVFYVAALIASVLAVIFK